jgi:hypothetical protein
VVREKVEGRRGMDIPLNPRRFDPPPADNPPPTGRSIHTISGGSERLGQLQTVTQSSLDNGAAGGIIHSIAARQCVGAVTRSHPPC